MADKSRGHTEQSIQAILYDWVKKKKNIIYPMSSIYMYRYAKHRWESDFFYATKHYMAIEIEIKITKKDFRRDKNKAKKHKFIKQVMDMDITDEDIFVPNLFYYCAPEGVIPVEEVPDYAGLYEITEKNTVRLVKKAETITHNPSTKMKDRLLDIFYQKSLKDEYKFIKFIMEASHANTLKEVWAVIDRFRKNKRI